MRFLFWLTMATVVLASALTSAPSAQQEQPSPAVVNLTLEAVPPSKAFEIDTSGTFVSNEFVDVDFANGFGANVLLPYLDDACPAGWEQLQDEKDGEPLFYAFGLLVTESGEQRSAYVRTPACVKQ